MMKEAEVLPLVMIVDDDALSRRFAEHWLRSVQMSVVSFSSGDQALREIACHAPDCIVLDLEMAGMSGIQVLEELANRKIAIPIVLFTATAEVTSAVRAMKLGAIDVLTKPTDAREFITAVKDAIAHQRSLNWLKAKVESARQRLRDLSPRERDVASLLGSGQSNKQIAYALKISPRTVEIHRARIMAKSGAASFAELVRLLDLSAAYGKLHDHVPVICRPAPVVAPLTGS